MELEALQQAKRDIICNASNEIERLRLFIKHLSYIDNQTKDSYNITKSVIKEIDSFKSDDMNSSTNTIHSSLINYGKLQNDECIEYMKQNMILHQTMSKQINYLKDIIDELSNNILKKYEIQKLKEYRPFRHYWDEKEFEDIFIASMSLNLPFNIHYIIALYAVGKIKTCFNPHEIDKELLILHENEHKEWFPVDYPSNAVVCSRCFRKYVKQCDGCKQIVLSNTINSIKMDGKWYCTTTIKCVFGFSDDWMNYP